MNEIEELEDVLDMILRGLQETLQNGETIPPEMQEQIAEELHFLTSEIDRLRVEAQAQEIEQEAEPSLPPIEEVEAEQAQVAQELTPEQPEPISNENIPNLEPAPYESSNINAFKYDPKTQKLIVKFQGKYPKQNGPVYAYDGVPKNIFDVFARGAVAPKTSGKNRWHRWRKGVTPSHGASMYALIREGNFPYRKLR